MLDKILIEFDLEIQREISQKISWKMHWLGLKKTCIWPPSVACLLACMPCCMLAIWLVNMPHTWSHRYFELKHLLTNFLFVANRIIQPKERSQSIILTGLSGSGKTESASHILSFIGEQLGESSLSNQTKEIVSSANYIFELFGNASTGLNKNSSRFTKLTEVSNFLYFTSYFLAYFVYNTWWNIVFFFYKFDDI